MFLPFKNALPPCSQAYRHDSTGNDVIPGRFEVRGKLGGHFVSALVVLEAAS